jgi:hypothetical protein
MERKESEREREKKRGRLKYLVLKKKAAFENCNFFLRIVCSEFDPLVSHPTTQFHIHAGNIYQREIKNEPLV